MSGLRETTDRRGWAAWSFVWGSALLFVVSLATFAVRYARGFDRPLWDAPEALVSALGGPLAFDAALMLLFGLHHSVFARLPVRKRVARAVGIALERSVYVCFASALLLVLATGWRPVPGEVWQVTGAAASGMRALQVFGVLLTAVSVGRVGALTLAGLDDPRTRRLLAPRVSAAISARGPYRFVRHPIYSGWFLLVFGLPTMNGSQLALAVFSGLYLLAAMPFEERTLHTTLGESYRRYTEQVRWRLLPGVY